MRFLCDVHISYKLVKHLRTSGFETTHLNDILDQWHTKDTDICRYADEHDLIIITKDADFKNSFLISNSPKKLVKVNLGNLSTAVLIKVITSNLSALKQLNKAKSFLIEVDQDTTTFIKKEE